ncbi:MAG TPA: ATP-binding protein [Sphingomicrobium sp.]|nr:ATP-binding protein [Sphingomicrobium sp.]
MRSWRSSAAYRIAFANFGAYAIGLALLGAIIFALTHISLTRQLDSMLSDEAATLASEYRSGNNRELDEAIAERESSGSATRMLYAVFAPDGRRIYGSFTGQRPANQGLQGMPFNDPREGPDMARGTAVDLSPTERLVVAVDSDWIERIEETVLIVFGAGFLGACLLGFGGAIILGEYLERRLRSISRSAEAIIGGDIRQRMPVGPRRDEFDQLAATLNRMLDRIEGLLENLRQVSSDIAHDLRTPLARLRARLEQGALDRNADAGDGLLEDAIERIDEVLSLFAAILRIAEVEGGETRRFFAPVDLSALVSELAESFAPPFEDEGRTLLSSVESGIHLEGDRELLAQAFINLLENAERHTPAGSIIRLTLISAGGLIYVHILDNGPGVPKADLGRVTKRFARLESARNTEGYGLGLSLVDAVAKLHGGRLVLKNAEPGLSATIELPQTSNR